MQVVLFKISFSFWRFSHILTLATQLLSFSKSLLPNVENVRKCKYKYNRLHLLVISMSVSLNLVIQLYLFRNVEFDFIYLAGHTTPNSRQRF